MQRKTQYGLNPILDGYVPPLSPQLMYIRANSYSQYIPTVGDLVIATIHHGASDVYYASITDYSSHATLPNLSFENATKKTRPQLNQGNLVYARVTLANKHMDPEIECVSSSTGKSEGLGPLTGGMLFPVSLAMARRLMLGNPVTQGELGVLRDLSSAGLAFEIAVGRNGRVWVNSKSVKITMVVGRAIMETDENALGMGEQAKLVQRLVREMGL